MYHAAFLLFRTPYVRSRGGFSCPPRVPWRLVYTHTYPHPHTLTLTHQQCPATTQGCSPAISRWPWAGPCCVFHYLSTTQPLTMYRMSSSSWAVTMKWAGINVSTLQIDKQVLRGAWSRESGEGKMAIRKI